MNISIIRKKTRQIILTYKTVSLTSDSEDLKFPLESLYLVMASTPEQDRESKFVYLLNNEENMKPILDRLNNCNIDIDADKPDIRRGMENLMNFFKDFQFDANFRFVNTFIRQLMVNEKSAKDYVYKEYDGCIEKDFTQLNNNTHEAILDDGDIIRIYTRHLE